MKRKESDQTESNAAGSPSRRISVDISGELGRDLEQINEHTGIPMATLLRLAGIIYIPKILKGEFTIPPTLASGS